MKGSNLLQYKLAKIHGEQIKHNNDKWRQRAGRLSDAGAFRVPKPRDTWERIDAPRFNGNVHDVVELKKQILEMVQIRTQSRHSLQCLLVALMLTLALRQDIPPSYGPCVTSWLIAGYWLFCDSVIGRSITTRIGDFIGSETGYNQNQSQLRVN